MEAPPFRQMMMKSPPSTPLLILVEGLLFGRGGRRDVWRKRKMQMSGGRGNNGRRCRRHPKKEKEKMPKKRGGKNCKNRKCQFGSSSSSSSPVCEEDLQEGYFPRGIFGGTLYGKRVGCRRRGPEMSSSELAARDNEMGCIPILAWLTKEEEDEIA